MTVWKRGSWTSKLSFFPAPCWISRPAVSGSVPGLPWGFPPSQPSGESSLHAERQQFDSQVLVGHWASHTFMSESSCRMVKKKKSLSSSSCISGLILSPSLLKHWHSWLILDDYSRCTKSQGQFFFLHDSWTLSDEAKGTTSFSHHVSQSLGFSIALISCQRASQRGKRDNAQSCQSITANLTFAM